LHDFNPGIATSGLFWTVALPAGSVEVNPGSGRASMSAANVAVSDFFTIPNSLLHGAIAPPVPATVSFAVHWGGAGKRVKLRDPVNGFTGEFVENAASMTWSASSLGLSYQSGVEDSSVSVFAEVGSERNGVFFPQG
jgi:hypothetical protein